MTQTPTSQAHLAHHPLRRAAGIDVAALAFVVVAALLTFFIGNGSARWVNAVVSAAVWALALVAVLLMRTELLHLWRSGPDEKHLVGSATAVVVTIGMLCIVVPMLVIMPFVFIGALG